MVTDRLTSDRVGGRRKGRAGPPTLAVPGTATSSRSAAAHYPPFPFTCTHLVKGGLHPRPAHRATLNLLRWDFHAGTAADFFSLALVAVLGATWEREPKTKAK